MSQPWLSCKGNKRSWCPGCGYSPVIAPYLLATQDSVNKHMLTQSCVFSSPKPVQYFKGKAYGSPGLTIDRHLLITPL